LTTEIFNLPDSSRVWIYQSNRVFSQSENEVISTMLNDFCKNWTAHDQSLHADSSIVQNQFIVIVVDESSTNASGCSIDKSVHFLMELEKKFSLSLFSRTELAFEIDDSIELIPMDQLKSKLADGTFNLETPVFHNMVSNLGDFRKKWKRPFNESWGMRFV
jgi:hypothetical protein